MKDNVLKECSDDICFGCGLCAFVCQHKAISMHTNELGEVHPFIDDSKCIECGLCKIKCPRINITNKNKINHVYAAVRKDAELRKDSASGGIGSVIMEKFLKEGFSVWSTMTDSNCNPVIAECKNEKDLIMYRGSKYVQSYGGADIYSEIKAYTKTKGVLFIGTPCQVAAIKNIPNINHDNLYTVDLLCHGVSPSIYLQEYLSYIKKKKKIEADNVSFRSNRPGCDFFLGLWKDGRLIYKKPAYESEYFSLFLKGISLRESCYQCPFKSTERVSDITIGDFIGLGKKNPYKHNFKNVSFVSTNSKKGQYLFSKIENELFAEERSLGEALVDGVSLKESFPKHKKRGIFKIKYKKSGFIKAARKVNGIGMVISFYKRVKWKVIRIVRRMD